MREWLGSLGSVVATWIKAVLDSSPANIAGWLLIYALLLLVVAAGLALVLYLVLTLLALTFRWLRRFFVPWLPAGVSPIVFTWPLFVVGLVGALLTFIPLVMT